MRVLAIILFACSGFAQKKVESTPEQKLQKAYQKEYAFLISQKRVLEHQLGELKGSKEKQLGELKAEILKLEKQWIRTSSESKSVQNQLVELERNIDSVGFDQERLTNTLRQASHRLAPFEAAFEDAESEKDKLALVGRVFERAPLVLSELSSPRYQSGQFFDKDGKKHQGEVILIGNIAGFAQATSGIAGPIAPVKGGEYQLLETYDFGDLKNTSSIPFFLVENMSREFSPAKEKSVMDELQAGGTIGLVIIALGLLSMFLVVRRYFLLKSAGASFDSLTVRTIELIKDGNGKQAQQICQKQNSSFGRVMADAVSNIEKPREFVEEVINEALLREGRLLTRFATMVMITAAVAPLLGLLGTVTGMISTFDVITEFGTGDPKMLSGGVSEALVTTKMGLIVAIPAVLAGNLLSNWASRIRSQIQQSVLSMVNAVKGA